jgi:hypothetical protein
LTIKKEDVSVIWIHLAQERTSGGVFRTQKHNFWFHERQVIPWSGFSYLDWLIMTAIYNLHYVIRQ